MGRKRRRFRMKKGSRYPTGLKGEVVTWPGRKAEELAKTVNCQPPEDSQQPQPGQPQGR